MAFPDAVQVRTVGDSFELSIPALMLIVRDRNLDRAWQKLSQRANAVRAWATELGLETPVNLDPTPRS